MILTYQWQGMIKDREYNENSKKGLDNSKSRVNISDAGKRSILRRLTAWCKAIKTFNDQPRMKRIRKPRYPVMITLTLSSKQRHSDKEIKAEILQPFIRFLIRNYGLLYYFWRAEKQQNGNIHFHVLIDKYIDKVKLQELWNGYQDKLQYVCEYHKITGKSNPPSTQVMSANNWYAFYRYLVKYVMKDEENGIVNGRKWYMSQGLANIDIYSYDVCGQLNDDLLRLQREGKIEMKKEDHYVCIFFRKNFDLKIDIPWLYYDQRNYYLELYKDLYVKPPVKIADPDPVPQPDTQNDVVVEPELFPFGEVHEVAPSSRRFH